jgi:hypothetical protein
MIKDTGNLIRNLNVDFDYSIDQGKRTRLTEKQTFPVDFEVYNRNSVREEHSLAQTRRRFVSGLLPED